jgi:hypothetical protein
MTARAVLFRRRLYHMAVKRRTAEACQKPLDLPQSSTPDKKTTLAQANEQAAQNREGTNAFS